MRSSNRAAPKQNVRHYRPREKRCQTKAESIFCISAGDDSRAQYGLLRRELPPMGVRFRGGGAAQTLSRSRYGPFFPADCDSTLEEFLRWPAVRWNRRGAPFFQRHVDLVVPCCRCRVAARADKRALRIFPR